MATVDIGIGHDDNLVVSQTGKVDGHRILLGADGDTHCLVEAFDFLIVEDLVVHGFLDIEDFTAQRQDGLECAVTTLLGSSTSRVTLDEEQLAILGMTGRAVGKLAGETAT